MTFLVILVIFQCKESIINISNLSPTYCHQLVNDLRERVTLDTSISQTLRDLNFQNCLSVDLKWNSQFIFAKIEAEIEAKLIFAYLL